MFIFSKIQIKYTRYIVDYDYPVKMDTRPAITFGVADHIFSRQNYYQSISFRQLFFGTYNLILNVIKLVAQQIKKWRACYDNI